MDKFMILSFYVRYPIETPVGVNKKYLESFPYERMNILLLLRHMRVGIWCCFLIPSEQVPPRVQAQESGLPPLLTSKAERMHSNGSTQKWLVRAGCSGMSLSIFWSFVPFIDLFDHLPWSFHLCSLSQLTPWTTYWADSYFWGFPQPFESVELQVDWHWCMYPFNYYMKKEEGIGNNLYHLNTTFPKTHK